MRKAILTGLKLAGEKSPMTLVGGAREALKSSLASREDFYAVVGDDFVYEPEAFRKWMNTRMKEILATCDGNFREAMVRYDLYFNTPADNFMVKVERASMAHALEVRCPFLDYRLIELESRIPVEWKANARKSKILMREVIKDMVPQKIVGRGKKGFTPPIQDWIREKKYMKIIDDGLAKLHQKGLVSDEWVEFYTKKCFRQRNFIYANSNIRLLLLIRWADMWL